MPTDCAMRRLSTVARILAPRLVRSKPHRGAAMTRRRRQGETPARSGSSGSPANFAEEVIGDADSLRQRFVKIGVSRDRHEAEADGHQDLIEFAGAVKLREEHPLEQNTDGGDDQRAITNEARKGTPQLIVAVATK